MKILMLSPLFPPDGFTGGIRPAKMAKYFLRAGHEVEILCFEPQSHVYADLLTGLGEATIRRLPVPRRRVLNDLGIAFLRVTLPRLRAIVSDAAPDWIFVSVPVFAPMVAAWLIRRRFGIPYLIDYRDLWRGDPYPAKGLKDALFRHLGRVVEPICGGASDLLVFISSAMRRDQMRLYPSLRASRCVVVSTGYDAEDAGFKDGARCALPVARAVRHVGTLDETMNVLEICRIVAAPVVRRAMDRTGMHVAFIGGRTDLVGSQAKRLGIEDRFTLSGRVPHAAAVAAMKEAAGLLILGSASAQRLNRKVFESIALNDNIFYLGSLESPTARVLSEAGYRHLASPRDVEKASMAFVRFLTGLHEPKALDRRLLRGYTSEALAFDVLGEIGRVDTCIVCSGALGRRQAIRGIDLFRCRRCGLLQQRRIVFLEQASEYLGGSYDEESGRRSEGGYHGRAWKSYDECKVDYFLREGSVTSVLDVGAGWGRLLAAFSRRGVRSEGIEPGQAAASHARAESGGEIWMGSVETYPVLGSFSLITMNQVLEHLTDPVPAIRKLYGALEPGGRLVIETGNAAALAARTRLRRWGYVKGEHIGYYTPRTARFLLARSGVPVGEASVTRGAAGFGEIYRAYLRRGGPDIVYGHRSKLLTRLRIHVSRLLTTNMTVTVRKAHGLGASVAQIDQSAPSAREV